ncbi:unnamed protein product, partial [Rotaria magnacalcarata]
VGDGDKYYRYTQITEKITSRHIPSPYRPVDFRLSVGTSQFSDVRGMQIYMRMSAKQKLLEYVFFPLVQTPNNRIHIPVIENNQDRTVSIKYQPFEVGLHELDVDVAVKLGI